MEIVDNIVFLPFESTLVLKIIGLVVLLFLSAMMSASETSFFSLSPNDIEKLRKKNTSAANAALTHLSQQDYLLATILIGNNLVNICAVVAANSIIDSMVQFADVGGALEFVVKTVIVTFLLLLFGEIMPKVFATYNAMSFVQFIALPLTVLKNIFKPLSWVLITVSNRINRNSKTNISIDELSSAIEITSTQSIEEQKILSGIVNFVNTEVTEIMKSRLDMVVIDDSYTIEQVQQIIIKSGYSRLPVYHESIDNITGILYVKDLLPHVPADKDFEWQTLCRKPYFVSEYKKINDLMLEFKRDRVHLAIVVDEYGSTLGLVSLEDILEEVVGDISDESDRDENFYTKIDNNTYLFEGKSHVNDVERVLELDENFFEELAPEAETIAGVMLEVRGDFLKQTERVNCHHLTLSAESVNKHQIRQVKITINPR
ncbi:MAG: gliding motility-associated protein GldE [Rikenellaceae bacterium]|nr:gliding motility-associated protein GldE [Rikenellaceae bacterium]MBO7213168.1 gliding motility-associated protein GldE [Rikenellaceae bacterium]